MNPQIAQVLKIALAFVGALLVSRGLLPQGGEGAFADQAGAVVGGIVSIGAMVSAAHAVRRQGALINTALALPEASTFLELRQASYFGLSGGMRDLLIKQAVSTVLLCLGDRRLVARLLTQLERLRDTLNEVIPPAPRGESR